MRNYRSGDTVEDLCRSCKLDRLHTVIAADAGGRPLRVQCDYCGSQHNFRGGAHDAPAPSSGYSTHSSHVAPPLVTRQATGPVVHPPAFLIKTSPDGPLGAPPPSVAPADTPASMSASTSAQAAVSSPHAMGIRPDAVNVEPAPNVTERELVSPPLAVAASAQDLEAVLRRIIREESGITVAEPAEKWRDGLMVLRPGRPGVQERSWPIETFFHKVVMIRNRLRTLEQQINAMDGPDDVKIKLQSYITACYGSLTSFNVLFADEQDQFKGTGVE